MTGRNEGEEQGRWAPVCTYRAVELESRRLPVKNRCRLLKLAVIQSTQSIHCFGIFRDRDDVVTILIPACVDIIGQTFANRRLQKGVEVEHTGTCIYTSKNIRHIQSEKHTPQTIK